MAVGVGRTRMMIAGLTLTLLTVAMPRLAPGKGPDAEPIREPDALYREFETRRSMAERELRELPSRVEAETDRVVQRLNRLFLEELQPKFAAHYEAVEATVQDVTLPEHVGGNLWVYWEQLKSPVSRQGLERLAETFVSRVERETRADRERLKDEIDRRFQTLMEEELAQAQSAIRAPLQEVVGRHFPSWQASPLPAPLLPTVDTAIDPSAPGGPATTLMAGMLLLVFRKMIRKILLKITSKIVGKVIAKLVPVIGWILVALAVWDAAQAKSRLETEFRSTFIAVYREEFTPQIVWEEVEEETNQSLRQTMQVRVRDQLKTWEQHCRAEAQRMVDSARAAVVIPDIEDYFEAQQRLGRTTQEVADELSRLDRAFGSLLAEAPTRTFQDILVDWPDTNHQVLRQWADEMGTGMLELYDRYRRPILESVHRLGPGLFLEVLKSSPDVDWREVAVAFEDFGSLLQTEQQKRGLLVLVESRIAHQGIRAEILGEIGQRPTLFRWVAASPRKEANIFSYFAAPEAIAMLEVIRAEDAELATAFLEAWPLAVWSGYHGSETAAKTLAAVAVYRNNARGQSASDFARELAGRDELTEIYQDVGLDGLRIWDAFVKPDTGTHQRDVAARALALHKQGIRASRLMTEQQVAIADHFARWPGIGLSLVEPAQELGRLAYFLMYGLVAILLLVVVRFVLRIRSRRGRKR